MPIPAGTARISLVGHQGTSEIFDTSFWIGGTNVPTSSADASTLAGQVATALEGPSLTTIKEIISADSGYDEVRVYSYPTGGPTASFVGSAPIVGGAGSGSPVMPLQVCVVATLHTGLAGRSHRGRMYLPADGATLSTGHQLDAGTAGDLATALAGFFGAVNELSSENDVCVVSQTLDTFTIVTSVSCDQKMDIQRRRANRQPGGVKTTAVV